jgi:hypothetical protein
MRYAKPDVPRQPLFPAGTLFDPGSNQPGSNQRRTIAPISNASPNNFIYPLLAKRKVSTFDPHVTSQAANNVLPTLSNLTALVDRMANPGNRKSADYLERCRQILGLQVVAYDGDAGKQPGYVVGEHEMVPLTAMGEGVAPIAALLIRLIGAEGKLFLIEELENDLHPDALKQLLDLIVEKSNKNQFIITTHSNIVLKRLGGAKDAKVFKVRCELVRDIPTSTVAELGDSSEDRSALLAELGYEFSDSELWAGWLLLEESSAEKIIREYLIPWFAQSLQQRLRTFSARSRSLIERKFEDFNDLFVFLHLQPTYRHRAWVLIDGGGEEKKIIDKLKEVYAVRGWGAEHFRQLSKHDFEDYYPDEFQAENAEIKATDRGHRQSRKILLREKVENWIKENEARARKEFSVSAKEVIDFLKMIEENLSR